LLNGRSLEHDRQLRRRLTFSGYEVGVGDLSDVDVGVQLHGKGGSRCGTLDGKGGVVGLTFIELFLHLITVKEAVMRTV
jgi:hypothetical protein